MPWEKLSQDDFINLIVGRLQGDVNFEDQIRVQKPKNADPERAKLVNGKIIGDTGDMILVEKEDKEFRSSYNELMEIEYDNKKKIDEISIKIKRIAKKFQELLHINKSLEQKEEVDIVSMVGVIVDSKPINENSDKKSIKYIQEDFQKLYTRIKDQVERIDLYLNEIMNSNEFDLLVKKLQTIGVSFHKLKSIDKQREQKMINKKEQEELYREEIMSLKIMNRDLVRRNMIEKIQVIQEYQNCKEIVSRALFENSLKDTSEQFIPSDKVRHFLRDRNDNIFDLNKNYGNLSKPQWFTKHQKKKKQKKKAVSKLNILHKKTCGIENKYLEGIIDSVFNA